MAACLCALLLCHAKGRTQAVLTADAHISSAQPDVNSGGLSNLNVGGGYTTLLQFDLSLLPAGTSAAQVSRAVLRVYANRVDATGTVALAPLQASWAEFAVTSNNQPTAAAPVQTAGVASAGQFITFDITPTVRAWVAGTIPNDGLALSAATAVVAFDSKENDLTSHAPELVLTLAAGGGSTGAAGATGPTGAIGPTGATGPQGAAGPQGIAGLQGPAGATGPTGSQGTTGIAGVNGVTGATGLQGFVGLAGATGSTGPTGATGAAGFVYQSTYNSAVNYALGDVVLFVGSSYVSLLAGNHGNTPSLSPAYWALLAAQGSQGTTGLAGPTGATGVQGLPGSIGPPGERGDQGQQGIAGQAGAQGVPGVTGSTGPQGPIGAQGVSGTIGLTFRGAYDSTVNYALADGVLWQGSGWVSLLANNHGNTPDQSPAAWLMFAAQGAVGPTGSTGLTGTQGLQGLAGPTGSAGVAGPTGATGAQGLSLTVRGAYDSTINYALNDIVSWHNGSYVSLAASNHGNTPDLSPSSWQLLSAQGTAGPQGTPGATGATGTVGPQGLTGPTGAQGAPIAFSGIWDATRAYAIGDAVSFSGASYIALAANTAQQPDIAPTSWGVLSARGAQGPVGAQGLTGAQGIPGNNGTTGAQGPAGQAGAQGLAGPTGATGPQGPQGSTGLSGTTGATGSTGFAGPAGINFRSAWNSQTHYAVNDAVTFAGSAYLAQAANTNDEPDTDAASWSLLAQAGGAGPTGAAATVSVGTVSVLAPGATPTITNSGTATAAVLNFGIPQGATGATGPAGAAGSGGNSTTATGVFAAMYHSVDYTATYYALNNINRASSENSTVITWVPLGCTAARLDVYSQQSNNVTVTLRSGTSPSGLAATTLTCTTAQGSCTVTSAGGLTVPAGSFLDLSITGASGTTAAVWTAIQCN